MLYDSPHIVTRGSVRAYLSVGIPRHVAAFPCYNFKDSPEDEVWSEQYLVADVSIECGSPKHDSARAIAWFAIWLYPIGLFALNGVLLHHARAAIVAEKPTPLSRAISFLHREHLPAFYFWELMEMARRFVLIGLFVIGPFHPGSMMQLALAALACVIYLVVQAQAMPYRSWADNYVGIGCSFSLAVLFIACTFYKVNMLTELRSVQDRMSIEQREDFVLSAGVLTFIIVLSVIGTLVLSCVVLAMQVAQRTRDFRRDTANKQLLLLRYVRTNEPVQLPAIQPAHYHLFLSQ